MHSRAVETFWSQIGSREIKCTADICVNNFLNGAYRSYRRQMKLSFPVDSDICHVDIFLYLQKRISIWMK